MEVRQAPAVHVLAPGRSSPVRPGPQLQQPAACTPIRQDPLAGEAATGHRAAHSRGTGTRPCWVMWGHAPYCRGCGHGVL